MPKSRVSSSQRASRAPVDLTAERVRFLGLSLGGGKADKACLAVVDYYPSRKKVFLTKLFDRLRNEDAISADAKIVALVEQHSEGAQALAIDVPWRLPPSLRDDADPRADGGEHVRWMDDYLRRTNRQKKPKRLFLPYTQRCVEAYLSTELEEKFVIDHAMGANTAPVLARAMYLHRRFTVPLLEVHPRVALWRIGRSLDVAKSHLRTHRKSVGGADARREILASLSKHEVAFIYEQDRRAMVDNNHAFEAFLCALTAFLKYKKRTEARPAGFPRNEDWVEIPQAEIPWKDL